MIIVTGAQGGIGTALLNDLKKLNQPCLAITTSEIPKDTNDLIEYVRVAKSGDDQTLYEEYLNIFKKYGSQTTGVALLHGVVYYADREDQYYSPNAFSSWDVSSVTDFYRAFYGASSTSFFLDVAGWNISQSHLGENGMR